MVTVKDIAEKCGVSTATVSKALNGYGDISEKTAERIRKMAEEMHYTPNVAARQLKTNASHTIGVLFEDDTNVGLTHEFFAAILNAAKVQAEKDGYDILFISRNIAGRRASFLEHARYRSCDGVLIANLNYSNEDVRKLIYSEIPTVTIDYTYNDHSSVLSANVEGEYELTKYVISRGHRKIAFVHGENTSVTKKRLIGFYRALTEAGITVPDRYIVESRYHDLESCRTATQSLLALPDRPTCILYSDDYSYIGGRGALTEAGLSVPDDISVVGYDGIEMAKTLYPPLTTFAQDTEAMGKRAIQKLIEIIENPKTCRPEEIEIPGRLVPGGTVARIQNG